MLEGLQEVGETKKGEGQTISAYQNNLSILPTLLVHKMDEHTCMGLSTRLEVLTLQIMAHLFLLLNTMFHVQCVTLQHECQW